MTKRISVYESDNITYYTAAQLIDKINGIVEKYNISQDEISFETSGSYDGYDVCMCYYRPETDQEMAARIEREEQYRLQREVQQRKEYEALKAKFG